jgi:hypothetical protein
MTGDAALDDVPLVGDDPGLRATLILIIVSE